MCDNTMRFTYWHPLQVLMKSELISIAEPAIGPFRSSTNIYTMLSYNIFNYIFCCC